MASLLCLNKAILLPREPLVTFRRDQALSGLSSDNPFFSLFPIQTLNTAKPTVVFVLGSSGTGKSKLAISLALRFGGEIINSDKMQVYDGLTVITNKVTPEECAGVPHHLLGGVHQSEDYTAADFRRQATAVADEIISFGRLPIIAGGSNSYVKELVVGDNGAFSRRYDCCFIWVDVDRPVLHEFVAERVDKMVEQGLVAEARSLFDPAADYSRGIWRSIGVPEMDRYFRREPTAGEAEKAKMLEEAFAEIKANTCKLTCAQREKIRRFESVDGWRLHRADATEAVLRRNETAAGRVWEETVVAPSIEIVRRFVGGDHGLVNRCCGCAGPGDAAVAAAVAAAVGTTN